MSNEHSVKVCLAQVNPVTGNIGENVKKHLDIIKKAAAEGADLAVFPELSLTGYFLKDGIYDAGVKLFGSSSADFPAVFEPLLNAGREFGISVIAGFIENDDDNNFYNSSFCLSEGKVVNVHRKVYLPTYGMFEELRYFKPGNGFGVFDLKGTKYSVLTCEDAWHLSSSYIAVNKGAHVIIVNSASPARGIESGLEKFASMDMWEELLSVMAFYYRSYVVFVNRVGFEDGVGFSGGSCVFNPLGRVDGKLPYLDEGVMTVDLNLELLNNERARTPLIRDENLNITLKEIEGILNAR